MSALPEMMGPNRNSAWFIYLFYTSLSDGVNQSKKVKINQLFKKMSLPGKPDLYLPQQITVSFITSIQYESHQADYSSKVFYGLLLTEVNVCQL